MNKFDAKAIDWYNDLSPTDLSYIQNGYATRKDIVAELRRMKRILDLFFSQHYHFDEYDLEFVADYASALIDEADRIGIDVDFIRELFEENVKLVAAENKSYNNLISEYVGK